jgi:isomerase DpgB
VSELSRLTDVFIEVNSPAVLSTTLIDEINKVCDTVENAKKDVAVLLHLTGEPDGPAGEPWPHDLGIHTVNKWERALRRLERVPAFTLAVVEGTCAGPALDLLLTTDHRIATPGSRLRTSLVGGSTWPGMTVYRLANQLGVSRARRLALLGTEVSAGRAVEWGLLDAVAEDARDASRLVLNSLAGVTGTELAIRRQLLTEAMSTNFEDALGSHLAACDRALRLARTGVDSGPGIPAP